VSLGAGPRSSGAVAASTVTAALVTAVSRLRGTPVRRLAGRRRGSIVVIDSGAMRLDDATLFR